VGPALDDLAVRGPLDPEQALQVLGRDAGAADAAVARSETPDQYRAPERILGRDAGERSDVYSLSALLYSHLTGSVPFPHGRRRAVLFWHLHAPRPRPTELRPELPKALDAVIVRGMASDPDARHRTVEAFLDDARSAMKTRAPPHAVRTARPPRRRRRLLSHADPTAPPNRRRRRRALPLAAALALVVGAAAAGFAVGGELDDAAPKPAVASAGSLRLAVPADWRRLAPEASPTRLRLTDPIVLSSGGGRLVAGMATRRTSIALLERLRAAPRAGEVVALGHSPARRYRAQGALGLAAPITVFGVPTDVGVATVACLGHGASAARSFLPRCERAAAGLVLAEGRAVSAGPSARQASGLRRALRRLNAARSSYRARVARARTARRQAAAARMLARAHARTARSLRELALTGFAEPGARAAIRALERSTLAYRGAARAAARRRTGGYARARRSALAADAALRRALRSLRVAGYAG
jgi:hypothetical protein